MLLSVGLALNARAAGLPPLSMQILSSKSLSGTAGDFVAVQGRITNTGGQPLSDVTTYLSLMDNHNKLPVDLEDWSAEKGLYIGTIGAGQTLPLDWKIHFVKAGAYSLIIVAEAAGYDLHKEAQLRISMSPRNGTSIQGRYCPWPSGRRSSLFSFSSCCHGTPPMLAGRTRISSGTLNSWLAGCGKMESFQQAPVILVLPS